MNPVKSSIWQICLVITAVLFILPQEASAVPAFARQTGLACNSCHFQSLPTLNAFGRAFRASGYNLVGDERVIEDDNLSLPAVLNASIIAKIRYEKTNGNTASGTDYGSIQWPDEAALVVGGRLAKNAGFMMELGQVGQAVDGTVDTTSSSTTQPINNGKSNSFLSSKIHINVAESNGAQFSVIPFSTDSLGVGYGFELMNTGAQRSQRPIENRTGYSAAQALGLASGEATGIALVASRDDFFINYSPWVPGWGGTNQDVKPSGLANYLRAAYMPTIKGWDSGFGVQWLGGDVTVSDGTGGETKLVVDGWVVDFQAQGEIGATPLSVFASYGSAAADPASIYNTNANDATAFAILGQVGVTDKANVYLAYRTMDDGAATNNMFNAVTYGANYLLAQNIRLELFGISESGSGVDARSSKLDSTYLLQMFVGF
jgi:hypothetical protein